MTMIFKVADQENISTTMENMEQDMSSPRIGDGRKFAASLDDDSLADECECIEKCASSGKDYTYFEGWPQDQIDQLREYAAVVGLKSKMVPIRQSADEQVVNTDNDDADMKRLAEIPVSRARVSSDLALAVGDPFNLTDISDLPKSKDDWERVRPEVKLADQPKENARLGSVMPIRGEYDHDVSISLRVRRGENSVADPDAIGKLAKQQDNGERLKQEAATKKIERESSKSIWQQEAISQAKAMGPGALSRGTVILASDAVQKLPESSLDLRAAMSELGKKEIGELPDFTDGEKLHQIAEDRKAGIQRKVEASDWQRVKGTTKPTLQDSFADALELQLQRAGITKAPSIKKAAQADGKPSDRTTQQSNAPMPNLRRQSMPSLQLKQLPKKILITGE